MKTTSTSECLQRTLSIRLIRDLILIAFALSWPSILDAAPPAGQLLSSQCFQCHGTNGQAVGGFESIAGKNTAEMYNELLEMSRRRPESIMDLQVRAFTPAQLQLIAAYLSTLPPGASDDSTDD